jgi:transposase
MMVVPAGVRVLVATQPVDFRKGMDGLGALARERFGQDPFSGVVLVFRAKRADRIKLLFWEGSGLMLVSKRLEQGGFKWSPIVNGAMRLSPAQLAALLEGFDRSRVHVPRGDAAEGGAMSAIRALWHFSLTP